MSSSLNQLYRVVGISKQAVAQYALRQAAFAQEVATLEVLIQEVRKVHGGCGLEKLYYRLAPQSMGRDRFIEVFQGLGYGLQRSPNRPRTTIKADYYYPNLIEGMGVGAVNRIWQTDLTYIQVGERFYYLIFIIDIYSKQILGYGAFDHMRAEANLRVLKMALESVKGQSLEGLIHHSDRGSQYIAKIYCKTLNQWEIWISMGASGPENAYAERINGIIKNEYLAYKQLTSFAQLKRELKKAVKDYNFVRPHNHLNRMSPLNFIQEALAERSTLRPIVLIPTKEGPEFQQRKKQSKLQAESILPPACPTKNNSMFYHQTVNAI